MCGHLGVVSNFVSPQGILNQLTNSYAGLARMFSKDPIISVLLKSDCPMSGYSDLELTSITDSKDTRLVVGADLWHIIRQLCFERICLSSWRSLQ